MANRPEPPQGPVAPQPAHGLGLRASLPGPHRRRRAGAARRRGRDFRRSLRLQADHRQRLRDTARATAISRRWFEYLLLLVVVMAIATAVRYLFRLLARRAHRRGHPPRGAPQPAPPVARLLRGEPPGRDHLADHGRHDDHRTGRRHHRLGRLAQHGDGPGLHRHPVRARAQARGDDAARRAAGHRLRSSSSAARSARFRPEARTASPTSAPSPAKCSAR